MTTMLRSSGATVAISALFVCACSQVQTQIGMKDDSAVVRRADPIRYRVSDAHFHLVDFLQDSDGIDAAVEAMNAAGVDHAMISGMPIVKKRNAADRDLPVSIHSNIGSV